MERIHVLRVEVLVKRNEIVRPARRRRTGLQARIRGQQGEIAGVGRIELHDLHFRRTGVHLRLVVGPHARADESRAGDTRSELVGRAVQAVAPDAELRIVGEVVGDGVGVVVPTAAHRIAGARDREAFVNRRRGDGAAGIRRECEIGDDPAILEGIVDHHRIAVIVGIAQVAEMALAHERVERERRNAHTGRLVVDADRRVDGLDVISRTDVAVGIRRMACAPVEEVEALETQDRRGRRGRKPRGLGQAVARIRLGRSRALRAGQKARIRTRTFILRALDVALDQESRAREQAAQIGRSDRVGARHRADDGRRLDGFVGRPEGVVDRLFVIVASVGILARFAPVEVDRNLLGRRRGGTRLLRLRRRRAGRTQQSDEQRQSAIQSLSEKHRFSPV